ncbi:MAG: phenylalanine--tRNA ligase subunit beta, partial [Pseudomonadota bacterium]
MKFSVTWLRRHLEFDADLPALLDAMVAAGLEVEHVEDPRERLAAFSVGRVAEAAPHPDADRLKVCQAETKDGTLQIVCGAPNARAGIYVAYAPVGAYVPGIDVTLTKAKIRGVESRGMMCSSRELELGDDHDGIMELADALTVGAPLADALNLTDPVIDFETTPNRPDWLGVRGIARDLAAAGFGALKPASSPRIDVASDAVRSVRMALPDGAETACPVFTGRMVTGVKNGPSPAWIQDALRAVGLRPINALVDITNYISMDRARPLHVFDADKLQDDVHVRLATDKEGFSALDGKDYVLEPSMCVIADAGGAIGLGGVMGGMASGCTEDTKNVFIECAYFDPSRTRATGGATGIVSDARYRFERGVDTGFIEEGLDLATEMVLELCGGAPGPVTIAGAIPDAPPSFAFEPKDVKRLTGADYDEDEIARLLEALGCELERTARRWRATPPTWRRDLTQSADLVEEVVRLKGYDDLTPVSLPATRPTPLPVHGPAQTRTIWVKRRLAEEGLLECVAWSFAHEADAAHFVDEGAEAPRLANPISQDLGVMRPSALPNLIRALQYNVDHGARDIALFELGPSYRGQDADDQETVAVGVRGGPASRDWASEPATDIYRVKADLLAAMEAASVNAASLQTATPAPRWYHPGR